MRSSISHLTFESKSLSAWTLQTHGVYNPGQNTGVGSHSLLQGILLTQELNPGLPDCRQILYQLSHQGSPLNLWASDYSDKRNGWTGKLFMSFSISKFYNSRMEIPSLRIEVPQNKLFYTLPGVCFPALPKWHFIMKTHLQNSFWVPTATLWGENENIYLPPNIYQR